MHFGHTCHTFSNAPLATLVYNPKEKGNSKNKISLYLDVIQHLRRAYKIIKSLCQYIANHKLTTNH